jgi:N-acetylglucosaminyldiphosphoundecaprenol N-acetyl-beta-D-mannosaminyltransferase
MSSIASVETEAAQPEAIDFATTAPARAGVDFDRNVICLLGLPFDQVGTDEASHMVQQAARTGSRLVVSTANVNFVVAARKNPAFRQSVVNSQLSLADGMPIVWISKLLGMALPERVPGSTLFERLCASHAGRPVKVYFFGAPDGVAEQASARVNAQGGGVRCVGFNSPGYGHLDSLSSREYIDRINEADPDFVVLSLGAEKGQAWIERNRMALRAPVISHLGAVVNMAGGSVKRAPLSFQRLGLEWLWRIKEEPHLWRRYARDGAQMAKILWANVLPLYVDQMLPHSWFGAASVPPVASFKHSKHLEIVFGTHVGGGQIPELRAAFRSASEAVCSVTLDFTQTRRIDARALGLLLLLQGHQVENQLPLRLVGVRSSLARQFRHHGVEHLLAPAAPVFGADVLARSDPTPQKV